MSFDLHRARTFMAVVRHGSVSAAADALGYTQSAVSQQLSTLERDVGLTLVDRAHRPLRPTRAGADLLPEVEALLARASALDAAVGEHRGLRRGRVELVAFGSALASIVPPVLAGLRGVELGLAEGETEAALAAVRAGEADVALVHLMPGEALAADAGLVRAVLGDDPLHAVLPARHRLAGHDEVALADLSGEALVVPRADGPAAPFRAFLERIVDFRVAYEVDELPAAQAFAAAGLGPALMHGLTLHARAPGVVVRPLTPAHARRVEVVRARDRRLPAATALFDALGGVRVGPIRA